MIIARVEKRPQGWYGEVVDGDEVLYRGTRIENRPGCALRTLLNGWQAHHGTPNVKAFEVNIDDW